MFFDGISNKKPDGSQIRHIIYKICSISLLLITPVVAEAADQSNLRGKRFCDIVIVKNAADISIYSTFGLSECPIEIWKKVTVAKIKEEAKADFVRLSGPTYWIIDGFKDTHLLDRTIMTFGGLDVRKVGELLIGPQYFFIANIPYVPREVVRRTNWIYDAGKPVYELIDSKGHIFLMQAYSIEAYPLTTESLFKLGKMLKLPPKWKFKTGVLKKSVIVPAINNKAIIIGDDLFNSYVRIEHDLLTK